MEPLIRITTIPIAYELKIENARTERQQGTAQLEISRDSGGGMRIKSQAIKVNLDTFEARNSYSYSPFTQNTQNAEKGKNAAYQATAQLAREGQLLLKAKIGEDGIGSMIAQRVAQNTPTGDFGLDFIPKAGPDISWSGPELTIQYEMDKLNFDLKVANGNFEFIPGNISLVITQRADVQIEYIGGPIYVPPSSDPSYSESVDVRA